MITRILVPLDGTPTGEAVLPKLEKLIFEGAPGSEAEVTLVHVISAVNFNTLTTDPKAQLPIPEAELTESKRKAFDYLEKVSARISHKGLIVKRIVRVGSAAEEIVKTARETQSNLIAMSTKGRNGVIRWMLGSVTDRVLRLEGSIPVLAINAHSREENPVLSMNSLQSLMKQTPS